MISGKRLRFDVDGVTLDGVYQWSSRGQAQELDGTDGSTGGFDYPEPGVKSRTITGRGFYRVGTGAWTGIVEGTIVENVKGFVTAHATDCAIDAPLCMVSSFEVISEVKGRIEFSFEMKTQGAYTISEVAA